jgi:FMN reductase [NAD(P)H]
MFTNCIHRVKLKDVYDLLQLHKEHCLPVIELILGYPQQEPGYRKGWLSGKGIVQRETYWRLAPGELQEVVAEYDDKERHIGMAQNWDELGFAHYLDWFYEKWSAKIPEEKQREFDQALTEARFLKRL